MSYVFLKGGGSCELCHSELEEGVKTSGRGDVGRV